MADPLVVAALIVWLSCSYLWALLSLCDSSRAAIQNERGRYLRGLTVHLVAGALVCLCNWHLHLCNRGLLGNPAQPFDPLRSFKIFRLGVSRRPSHLWSVVGLTHATITTVVIVRVSGGRRS